MANFLSKQLVSPSVFTIQIGHLERVAIFLPHFYIVGITPLSIVLSTFLSFVTIILIAIPAILSDIFLVPRVTQVENSESFLVLA
ncbi:MAG: hypothetical protein HS132_01440 [Planctomycetia bacterium]|nr:hypothetical protein [Planctomycetia bacterium]